MHPCSSCYWKWPTLACTQCWSLYGHSSIELCNTSTGKFAAAFRRDHYSILGSSLLPTPCSMYRTGASSRTQTQHTRHRQPSSGWRQKCSGLHLHFRLAFWKSGPKPPLTTNCGPNFRRWLASRVKNWWNWYLTPMVNFDEVRRAQLAKSTHLTSSLLPLWSFQIF